MVAKTPSDISPAQTIDILRKYILVDGFHVVADLQASHGAYMHDVMSGSDYLDFYAYFASQPIGYNHPRLRDPAFQARLLVAATTKVANSDVYTRYYADFVRTIAEVAGLPGMNHYFFIDGGALAVENALKAAFDWKVRKNIAAGRGEMGSKVIHFRQAFHGRSGYTMSLTNTDPAKIMYFPKFDWPRVDNPRIDFTLPEPQRTEAVIAREVEAVRQIEAACERHGHDIACLIVEPIQAEGGDHHFRPEFMRTLRELADQHEFLLIFDEVQTGFGITGRMWCTEHFGMQPDIIAFGKKFQTCGIIAGSRLDEVDSVFKVPSRINSTWGGNLVDMVRATQYLRIVQDENLIEHAATTGRRLLDGLAGLQSRHPAVTAARGRGLMCAFDLPTKELRDKVRQACWDRHMLTLVCGERSMRFRPVLDIDPAEIDRGLEILEEAIVTVCE
ncbi:MAG: L-lysine 6-transaminase [Planctomycetota bacterium]